MAFKQAEPVFKKISAACKAAAKRKFKVWPSAYASGWGVRCTKAVSYTHLTLPTSDLV